MLVRWILILLAIGFLQPIMITPLAFCQEENQWTSPDGKVVAGEFLRMENKAVVLKLATGKEVRVPLSSLSLESHLQALKMAKPEAFSKELIKAPVPVEAVAPTTVAPVTSIMDSPFGEDPTIDQFLKTAVGEWKRGNNFVVWHMLPPRMQQDIVKVIGDSMNTLGPTGTTTFRNTFSVLSSLASKKRDWIVNTELERLFPVYGNPDEKEKNWAFMVGMLQKLGDQGTWDAKNFQRDSVIPWLASMSEMLAFMREMDPSMNEITYNVVSQSADRAEVEATFGSEQIRVFNFQKVGNIWVVPEVMNSLRENVDKELKEAPTLEMMKTMMAGFALFGPSLSKMDQAKTRDEFEQTLKQSGLSRMLGSLPSMPGQAGASGQAGFPFGLPGLPAGIPGLSGGTFGTSSNN